MESGAERKCETVFHMGHPALHTAVLGKHIVGANNVRPELLRQAVGLTEGLIPLSAYADIPLFKGDKRLLCPVGHLLYERRLFFWLL